MTLADALRHLDATAEIPESEVAQARRVIELLDESDVLSPPGRHDAYYVGFATAAIHSTRHAARFFRK